MILYLYINPLNLIRNSKYYWVSDPHLFLERKEDKRYVESRLDP